MKKQLFIFSILGLFFGAAQSMASCLERFTSVSPEAANDAVLAEFCTVVDSYNAEGLLPLVKKKPKCSPDGPSSKCNPSSIVMPDFEGIGFLILSENGYSVFHDPELSAMFRMKAAASGLEDFDFVAADGAEWEFTDLESKESEGISLLNSVLEDRGPLQPDLLSRGNTVLLFVTEADDGGF